ncbi:MAG: type IV secretion system protein TrbL [Candidatus Magnetoglobus multicellularis str. Araruama]|uniref:Type IV secretion system protein TrbL n=1 Tax=Candidatus Magnetoglobus multicellularis str. Araruama TaxID=890399 RepID=A0A1V1PA75_9BACT|nr:MAG: type IV secretion system protein TrbL [Candidatus Magnetoglobus multicellularis str. Araruama]
MSGKNIYILCFIILGVLSVSTAYASKQDDYSTGTLTEVLSNIIDASQEGSVKVKTIALEILAGMFGISVLWLIIKSLASPGNTSIELIGTVLTLAIYTLIISFGPAFIVDLFKGLGQFGLIAGGNNISEELLLNPSAIVEKGYNALDPLTKNLSWLDTLRTWIDPLKCIAGICAYLSVMITHVIIAINMFLIIAEYFVYATVAMFLIPAGMVNPTRFLASNAVKGYFTLAARFMAHAMILSLMYGVFDIIQLPEDNPMELDVWHMTVKTWFLLAVVIFVPSSVAKTVSGGAPDLSAGVVLGGLMASAGSAYVATNTIRNSMSFIKGVSAYSASQKTNHTFNTKPGEPAGGFK